MKKRIVKYILLFLLALLYHPQFIFAKGVSNQLPIVWGTADISDPIPANDRDDLYQSFQKETSAAT